MTAITSIQFPSSNQLRLAIGDAAFDALPDAHPKPKPKPLSAPTPRASTGRSGIRREKVFGLGRLVPLDRNAKVRIMVLARALMQRTEKGKAYGAVTAKTFDVLRVLLWTFHNAATGKLFPSYETIGKAAHCSRTSVYSAIRALEQAGILTWVNRIKRVREYGSGLFGAASAWRWRVVRTSNGYAIADPMNSSKYNFQPGTTTQAKAEDTSASTVPPERPQTVAERRIASSMPPATVPERPDGGPA